MLRRPWSLLLPALLAARSAAAAPPDITWVTPAEAEPVLGDDASDDGATDCYWDGDLDGYPDADRIARIDGAYDCTQYPRTSPPHAPTDCDDADAEVHPGAADARPNPGAPLRDLDCSGEIDGFRDGDGDGFGGNHAELEVTAGGSAPDMTLTEIGGDCDDQDPSRFPGAQEPALDTDSNCDGFIRCFRDADNDGFAGGAESEALFVVTNEAPTCAAIDHATTHRGDCDPTDPAVFPRELADPASEVDRDRTCDGVAWCYEDADGDGHLGTTRQTFGLADGGRCPLVLGADRADCDDNDARVYPGNPDAVPGLDYDCDEVIVCFRDADGDGQGDTTLRQGDVPNPVVTTPERQRCPDGLAPTATDCDDACPSRCDPALPGCPAIDLPGDGIDQDCDGAERCYVDADGDQRPGLLLLTDDAWPIGACGVLPGTSLRPPEVAAALPQHDATCPVPLAAAQSDCDDTSPATFSGAPEIDDGYDNDCDRFVPVTELDCDGDGATPGRRDLAICDPTAPERPFSCGGTTLTAACVGGAWQVSTADAAVQRLAAARLGRGGTDCDDLDPDRAWGQPERCDGVDTDCARHHAAVRAARFGDDTACATASDDPLTSSADVDRDGFPDALQPELAPSACLAPAEADLDGDGVLACATDIEATLDATQAVPGRVDAARADAGDCDDRCALVHPGAEDETCAYTWYPVTCGSSFEHRLDDDADGLGVCEGVQSVYTVVWIDAAGAVPVVPTRDDACEADHAARLLAAGINTTSHDWISQMLAACAAGGRCATLEVRLPPGGGAELPSPPGCGPEHTPDAARWPPDRVQAAREAVAAFDAAHRAGEIASTCPEAELSLGTLGLEPRLLAPYDVRCPPAGSLEACWLDRVTNTQLRVTSTDCDDRDPSAGAGMSEGNDLAALLAGTVGDGATCADGADNDCDGLVDCDDPECAWHLVAHGNCPDGGCGGCASGAPPRASIGLGIVLLWRARRATGRGGTTPTGSNSRPTPRAPRADPTRGALPPSAASVRDPRGPASLSPGDPPSPELQRRVASPRAVGVLAASALAILPVPAPAATCPTEAAVVAFRDLPGDCPAATASALPCFEAVELLGEDDLSADTLGRTLLPHWERLARGVGPDAWYRTLWPGTDPTCAAAGEVKQLIPETFGRPLRVEGSNLPQGWAPKRRDLSAQAATGWLVLAGRFAGGFRVEDDVRNSDLQRINPVDAAPFFTQMFPFHRALDRVWTSEDQGELPARGVRRSPDLRALAVDAQQHARDAERCRYDAARIGDDDVRTTARCRPLHAEADRAQAALRARCASPQPGTAPAEVAAYCTAPRLPADQRELSAIACDAHVEEDAELVPLRELFSAAPALVNGEARAGDAVAALDAQYRSFEDRMYAALLRYAGEDMMTLHAEVIASLGAMTTLRPRRHDAPEAPSEPAPSTPPVDSLLADAEETTRSLGPDHAQNVLGNNHLSDADPKPRPGPASRVGGAADLPAPPSGAAASSQPGGRQSPARGHAPSRGGDDVAHARGVVMAEATPSRAAAPSTWSSAPLARVAPPIQATNAGDPVDPPQAAIAWIRGHRPGSRWRAEAAPADRLSGWLGEVAGEVWLQPFHELPNDRIRSWLIVGAIDAITSGQLAAARQDGASSGADDEHRAHIALAEPPWTASRCRTARGERADPRAQAEALACDLLDELQHQGTSISDWLRDRADVWLVEHDLPSDPTSLRRLEIGLAEAVVDHPLFRLIGRDPTHADLATCLDLRTQRLEAELLRLELADAVTRAVATSESPQAAVLAAGDTWTRTLAEHGVEVSPFTDGDLRPRQVHPMHVCDTPQDDGAVRSAPWRPVNIDVWFTGCADGGPAHQGCPAAPSTRPPTLQGAAALDVLLEHGAALPFFGVGSPTATPLELTPQHALPGDRFAWRARWQVMPGWQLFWRATEGQGGPQLAGLAGAPCEDLTLTAVDLAPTLLRAALLPGSDEHPAPPGKAAAAEALAASAGELAPDVQPPDAVAAGMKVTGSTAPSMPHLPSASACPEAGDPALRASILPELLGGARLLLAVDIDASRQPVPAGCAARLLGVKGSPPGRASTTPRPASPPEGSDDRAAARASAPGAGSWVRNVAPEDPDGAVVSPGAWTSGTDPRWRTRVVQTAGIGLDVGGSPWTRRDLACAADAASCTPGRDRTLETRLTLGASGFATLWPTRGLPLGVDIGASIGVAWTPATSRTPDGATVSGLAGWSVGLGPVVGLRWTAPPTRSWFRGRGPELTGPLVRPQLGIRFAARIAPSFGGALIQEQVELWSAFGPGGRYATPRQLVRPPASFGPWIALTFEQGAGAGAVDAVSTFGVRGGLALWFDLRRPAGKQAAFKVPKP